MICRKATFTIPDAISEFPDANYLSSRCQSLFFRAQNLGFCAFLAFGTPVFGLLEHKISVFVLFLAFGTLVFWHFEHKIEVFVRFYPSEALFSGISSTKSGFLCAFGVWNPRFRAFRVQNRGFCAREADVRHQESAILKFCARRAKSSASGSAQLCCM